MGVQLQYIFFSFLYQLLQESSGSVPDVAETMMISFLCTISKMPFYHPTMLAVQEFFLCSASSVDFGTSSSSSSDVVVSESFLFFALKWQLLALS